MDKIKSKIKIQNSKIKNLQKAKGKENKKREWFVNKAHSFKEAEEWDDKYYASLSPEERLSDIQICRENYYAFVKGANARRKRFSRVFRIIKQISG